MKYQYLNAENTLVAIIDDDGVSRRSGDVSLVPIGETIEPFTPPPHEIRNQIVAQTQVRLDDFARTRSYDGILSACTYATSSNPRFKSDGQYCVDVRDATWEALYQYMLSVEAGTAPTPTGFADVEPLLPVLSWP